MLTTELTRLAAIEAAFAWHNNCYGNGVHNYDDARVAASAVFQSGGYSNEDAHALGRVVADQLMRDLEERHAES